MPPKKPLDPSRRALRSIDDLHAADAQELNAPVRRLQAFARLRRRLYYTVLAPFGFLSRWLPRIVQTLSVALVLGLLLPAWDRTPPVARALMIYYVIGWIAYFAVSMRLARLLDEAAESVGLNGAEVLARWAEGAPAED